MSIKPVVNVFIVINILNSCFFLFYLQIIFIALIHCRSSDLHRAILSYFFLLMCFSIFFFLSLNFILKLSLYLQMSFIAILKKYLFLTVQNSFNVFSTPWPVVGLDFEILCWDKKKT